ncbi:MAG: DNA-binding protein [Verrucomicrobia bacterium]|nr:DNA-binding protein [Verrucomicrobiota bacterium]MBU4247883.1 DNA-binding protein [Verrucomicrobiota bacterium]MBU4292247.1 DNA-binding protein [Verrucomicrobiota bacterium]MBU4427984.1 DNA-binding protein [Verrucomicrobiota bacterium]MBU4498025.1 DNA-binding protein [Verrucomicrobiota bacterium]
MVKFSGLRQFNSHGEGRVVETPLLSERVQIERKQFFFDFKENASGRFLRITEDVGGHRDTIIIPATGLELIREAIDHAIKADKDTKM